MSHNQKYTYEDVLYYTQTRDRFLEVIAQYHNPSGDRIASYWFERIALTHDAVEATHGNRKREDEQPYIVHERAVALAPILLEDDVQPRQTLIRLLHDMLEDYPTVWPYQRIKAEYGKFVAESVRQLTKPNIILFGGDKRLRDREYRRQLEHSPVHTKKAKLSDRTHNMKTIWVMPVGKAIKKIIETDLFYLQIARDLHFLEDVLDEAVASAYKRMDDHPELRHLFL